MPRRRYNGLLLTWLPMVLFFQSDALRAADATDNIISFAPIHIGEQTTQTRSIQKSDFAFAFTTGDFSQTNDCVGSPVDSCNINVTFSPASSGLRGGAL